VAKKIKLPSTSVLEQAFWVAIVLAAAKWVLARFGGPIGARVLNYV
jgi:preprotein translocase subunit Sec61beta